MDEYGVLRHPAGHIRLAVHLLVNLFWKATAIAAAAAMCPVIISARRVVKPVLTFN